MKHKYILRKKISKMFILAIILILFFFLYLQFFSNKEFFQNEDLLFFPIVNKYSNENKIYYFNVNYKNELFKEINLVDTIKNFKKVKMQPGLEGQFDIVVKSNKKTKVKIQIINNNEIKNISFYIKQNKAEEVNLYIEGKNKITISWKWEYEVNEQKNKEDTDNGLKITDYVFYLRVIGEEDEK